MHSSTAQESVTPPRFAAEVERLALSLGVYTGGMASTVSLDAHTDRLEAGLGLMADMILRPRFDDDDVERLKNLQIGALTESADNPRMLATGPSMHSTTGKDIHSPTQLWHHRDGEGTHRRRSSSVLRVTLCSRSCRLGCRR